MILVRKNSVTDLMYVSVITGFGVPQNICPTSLKAKKIAKFSFEYMDIFFCGTEGLRSVGHWCEKFLVEMNFSNGSSSMRTLYPAAAKLASVIRAIGFSAEVVLVLDHNIDQEPCFLSVNCSDSSGVTRTLPSIFLEFENVVCFSESLGL